MIAKLGRLVRNPKFLAILRKSALISPAWTTRPATVSRCIFWPPRRKRSRQQISQRTKQPLAEAVKRKGIKLGSARPGHWEGREHLRGTRTSDRRFGEDAAADSHPADLRVHVANPERNASWPARRWMRLPTWLNDNGHTTTVGHPFNEVSVWRFLKRYLGDEFLGKVKDRGGRPQTIRCMETVAA